MVIAVGSIAFNAACAFTAVEILHLGTAGVALSLSLVAILNAVALLAVISRKLGGVGGREILANLLKVLVAASVMAVACLLVLAATPSVGLRAAVGIPLGALVFYAAASLLRIHEVAGVKQALLSKFRR